MKIVAIIVGAGKGKRFGGDIKKQFFLLNGKPLIVRTIEVFDKINEIDELFIVIDIEDKEYILNKILKEYKFSKNITLVDGGKFRQDSVYNGIMSTPDDTDIVVIHDGVRPLVSEEIVKKVIDEAIREGAVITAVKENLTTVSSQNGYIVAHFDRELLYRVQTPQAFKKDLIVKGLEQAYQDGYYGYDESSLLVRLGIRVKIVEGSLDNIKITSPDDLFVAEKILKKIKG